MDGLRGIFTPLRCAVYPIVTPRRLSGSLLSETLAENQGSPWAAWGRPPVPPRRDPADHRGRGSLAIELPEDVAWVLGTLGFQWIFLDEDTFREAGSSFRTLSSDLTEAKNSSDAAAKSVLEANRGSSIDAFGTAWDQLSGTHVRRLIEVCGIFADVLDGAADAIVVAKLAVIAQVVAAAATFAAAVAGSIFTLGLSDALGAAAEVGYQTIIREALKELEHALIEQAKYIAEQEVLSVLEGVVSSIIGQGLGDSLGVSHGFSTTAALDAGWKSGVANAEGVYRAYTNPKFLAQNVGGMALGSAVGSGRSAFGGGEGANEPSESGADGSDGE